MDRVSILADSHSHHAFIQEPDTAWRDPTDKKGEPIGFNPSHCTTAEVQKGTPQTSDNLRVPLCPQIQVLRNQVLGYFFPGSL